MRMPYGTIYVLLLILCFGCIPHQEETYRNLSPKIVEANGYVVPQDSVADPEVIPVDVSKLIKIPAGKPQVVPANTNIHPAGIPTVVAAGSPRICIPGRDTFSLPQTVPANGKVVPAGIPEIVVAKDMANKNQNPASFSFFGKLQGLKDNFIRCIYQDKEGNLWFGTLGGGVTKYDGRSFTHYSRAEGLSSEYVTCIIQDKAGNLWFGTRNDGVTKYDGRSFTHFTVSEGLPHNYVRSMLLDRDGNLWFGTAGGVSKYDGVSFTTFTQSEGLTHNLVFSLLQDTDGNIWIGTNGGGVSKYDGRSFTTFTQSEGLSDNDIISIVEDRDGNLWFSTGYNGVSKFDGKSFTQFTKKEGLPGRDVFTMLQDKKGNLWFGSTDGGVSKYDGTFFTHFTDEEGLSNNQIYSMLEDREGNLWFGTRFGGVSKLSMSSFTHFTIAEGLPNNSVTAMYEDDTRNLWFGTYRGVTKYNGKTFTHFTRTQGLSGDWIFSIFQDEDENLWFGTGNICMYDGTSFTYFDLEAGFRGRFSSIFQDRTENLWFGSSDGGVTKYDGKSFTHFMKSNGLPANDVTSTCQDREGNLWFTTYSGGVAKYDGKSFTHFTKSHGLSSNSILSMLADKDGNLWFGSNGSGISLYNGKSFVHLTEKQGLSSNFVFSILQDREGNLWFGTRFGLSCLSKNRVDTILRNIESNKPDVSEVYFRNFTYEDGFLGIGCNSSALLEASDGVIWIGANDRLTAYRPNLSVEESSIPNIQITGVELYNESIEWPLAKAHQDSSFILGNGVKVNHVKFDSVSRWYGLPQNLSLAYNNNYLTFDFVGITMHQPQKVKYQYKMEGMDEHWSAITVKNSAPYGNLPSGSYIFKVKAMSSTGYWSNEVQYPFTIRPPFWKTWWAYCFYGLIAMFLGWRIHRFQRARTISIEREKTRERELEQAKEIEKAYTELQATQAQLIQSEKMASLGEMTAGIAHEIQNPLNFVNNFSEVSNELLDEMKQELTSGSSEEAIVIVNDVKQNLDKILHHGKRADAIVKSMLQHSRGSSGQKELTDLNALCDEYLRLSYHGLRAKDKSFNAEFHLDFDPTLPKVQVVPQDIGRVLLNLINNAFYAVNEKFSEQANSEKPTANSTVTPQPHKGEEYKPSVTVTTKNLGDKIELRVKDNGNGIPQHVLDKIFQPFFTTKPTGQGTGLGLSLSYDIVKAHGGKLEVVTTQGEGSEFMLVLPVE